MNFDAHAQLAHLHSELFTLFDNFILNRFLVIYVEDVVEVVFEAHEFFLLS